MNQCPELGSPPQRLRPDTWPEHQDPVSHTARYMGSFLPFGKSEVFCQHSVGVVPHVDLFLMYFGEEGDLHILLLCRLEGPPSLISLKSSSNVCFSMRLLNHST